MFEWSISSLSLVLGSLQLSVVQGKRSEWKWESDLASKAPCCGKLLGSSSKGSTTQGEHQPPAGQARAAHPTDQHHQPGAQARRRAAADSHQAGCSVQGKGERLQDEGVPPEDTQCRSGYRPAGLTLVLKHKEMMLMLCFKPLCKNKCFKTGALNHACTIQETADVNWL